MLSTSQNERYLPLLASKYYIFPIDKCAICAILHMKGKYDTRASNLTNETGITANKTGVIGRGKDNSFLTGSTHGKPEKRVKRSQEKI